VTEIPREKNQWVGHRSSLLLASSSASQASVQAHSLFCVKRKAQRSAVAWKPDSSSVFKDCAFHPVSLFQFAAVSEDSMIQADGSGSTGSRVTRQSVLNDLLQLVTVCLLALSLMLCNV